MRPFQSCLFRLFRLRLGQREFNKSPSVLARVLFMPGLSFLPLTLEITSFGQFL
ncbi:hypothetical protein [Paenibacillus sp. A14]|uniref:hypothetical protein n=1 Tax=Paenibacillus sp. A14 TaxID=3119820 RepID=UPI002FDF8FAD